MTRTLAQITWQQVHALIPLGLIGILSWSVWLIRVGTSRLYRPVAPGFTTTTSVVVPAYREDPDILEQCLDTWIAQHPTEIIIVPDVGDTEVIARLTARHDPGVRVIPFVHAGKRSALGVGIRAATSEILVLSDSDTAWQPGMLAAIQAPFEDPSVGGVGTRQNAQQATSSVWRRIADWMLDVRYLDYVPSQGRVGAVACLSGRTAAYRRAAVLPVLGNLEHEFFLGRRCISGDDGRLTWLILASGYKTVHQSSARVLSMFPDTLRAFVRQRVRWSRNSYRCYLTAMWKGWLWKRPLLCMLTVFQVSLTPVTMGFAIYYVAATFPTAQPWVTTTALAWILIGRTIRGISHLIHRPSDLLILPLFAMVTICIALPIKAYAFVTMNRQGWLTRTTTTIGGEGQSAASLIPVTAGD